MAIDAPINVLKKFTTSLDIQANPSFSCNVAPIKLSIMVATNEANVATPTPAMDGTNPTIAYAYIDKSDPPTIEARVPSNEMAPSVPLGTGFNEVIRNVVFPYALPISDANVSANFVANDAT